MSFECLTLRRIVQWDKEERGGERATEKAFHRYVRRGRGPQRLCPGRDGSACVRVVSLLRTPAGAQGRECVCGRERERERRQGERERRYLEDVVGGERLVLCEVRPQAVMLLRGARGDQCSAQQKGVHCKGVCERGKEREKGREREREREEEEEEEEREKREKERMNSTAESREKQKSEKEGVCSRRRIERETEREKERTEREREKADEQ